MWVFGAAWARCPVLLRLMVFVTTLGCCSRVLEGLQQPLNIGALLAFGTAIGDVALTSLKLAVQDVNNDTSILPNHKLVLQTADSTCNAFMGSAAAVRLLQGEVVAVAGPQTSNIAQFTADLGAATRVPFVSFSATDSKLTMARNPFFLRTVRGDGLEMESLAHLVALYKWTEVRSVSTDDDWGLNGVEILADYLYPLNVNLVSVTGLSPDANATEMERMFQGLLLQEARVVVVHLQPALARLFFRTAAELDLDKNGFVWLMSDAMCNLLDDFSPSDSIWGDLQGVMGLRPYINRSSELESFEERWKTAHQASNSSGSNYQLSVYGLHAYDTVWLIARALDTYVLAGKNLTFTSRPALPATGGGGTELAKLKILEDGDSLLEIMKGTKFQGLTGHIQLGSNGDPLGTNFEILNLIGRGPRTVGYWNRDFGFSPVLNSSFTGDVFNDSTITAPSSGSQNPEDLQDIIWPGGYSQVPKGWAVVKNGQRLLVGVPRKIGFPAIVTILDNSTNQYRGFSIDVFQALTTRLPYQLNYTYVPIGNGIESPSYDDIVQQVADGRLDLAVGDFAITTERAKIVDYTQPYSGSGLVVLVETKSASSSNAWSFMRPFSALMWCVTGGFFFFTGVAVWILEHKKNPQFQGTQWKQLVTMLWYIFSTLFFAQREKTKSTLGRAVVIIWLFVVLIITSSYTASLTSILTVEQLVPSVKGFQGLLNSKLNIGFQSGSYVEGYLLQMNVPRSRLVGLDDQDEYYRALKDGTVGAIVDELPYVELFLSGQCGFTMAGGEFTKGGWGFVFPHGSRLAIDMSTAILQLAEDGRLQIIHDYWLNSEDCNNGLTVDANRLDLRTFWGLFVITGSASLVCVILYYCKLFSMHKKSYIEDPSDSAQSSMSKHKTFLRSFVSFVVEPQNGRNDEVSSRGSIFNVKSASSTGGKASQNGVQLGVSRLDSPVTAECPSQGSVQFGVSRFDSRVTAESPSQGSVQFGMSRLDSRVTAESPSQGSVQFGMSRLDSRVTAESP